MTVAPEPSRDRTPSRSRSSSGPRAISGTGARPAKAGGIPGYRRKEDPDPPAPSEHPLSSTPKTPNNPKTPKTPNAAKTAKSAAPETADVTTSTQSPKSAKSAQPGSPQTPQDEETPKKKSKKKLLVIILLVVVLAGGGMVYKKLHKTVYKPGQPVPPGQVLSLGTLTVNTSDGHYVQVGIDLQLTKPASEKKVEQDKPQLLNAAIADLGQQTYSGLLAPTGRTALLQALLVSFQQALGPVDGAAQQVSAVYFTSFVLQ